MRGKETIGFLPRKLFRSEPQKPTRFTRNSTSPGAGLGDAARHTAFYVQIIARLFSGKENVRDSVGGPLMIAKQTKEAADQGMGAFWFMLAMLSIALAVFNILPIPALDGGHLMFLLYEGITRREPSLKVRMAVQQVGMVLLLAFMAFVIFNDAANTELPGVVKAFDDQQVTIDFNHPLAGKTLEFEVQIFDVTALKA